MTAAASDDLLLEPAHLAALAATAALCVATVIAARRHPGEWMRWLSAGLAVVLVGGLVAGQAYRAARGGYDLGANLPLELTDAVTLIAALALVTRRQLAFELTYFWGLTGSLQAVLTPALEADEGFASFFFWQFFAVHSGVVVAAAFLAFGFGMTPRAGAVARVLAITVAWAAAVGVANLLTGGNYMFLRERPDTPSLLDYFGPWPLYLLGAAAVAAAMFALLDLPFRRRRRRPATIAPAGGDR